MKKLLVVGVIVLFLGLAIAPSISSELSEVNSDSTLWEHEIRYYNPDNIDYLIGWGCQSICYWIYAIRLTQDELYAYSTWDLTKIRFSLRSEPQYEVWARLIIYGEGTPTQPGDIIYEDDTLYYDETGYHIIELDTPIPLITHDEIWVGIEFEIYTEGFYPVPVEWDHVVPGKSDWFSDDNGASWIEYKDYGLDLSWFIGAIVEYEDTELLIGNITGPIGVNAEIQNIGNVNAYNVHYLMIVSGGIFNMIFRIASDTITKLDPDEIIPIYSDLMFGFGPITINITASASNAYEDSIIKKAFIIGPFVFTK